MQRNDRRGGGGGDIEHGIEGSSISEHGHIGFVEEGLSRGKEVSLQHAEGVGYVQIETDQPEIEPATTTAATTAATAAAAAGATAAGGDGEVSERMKEMTKETSIYEY